MSILKTWLLRVTACAVLVSLADQLAPDGTMKKITRFTGGILLMLSMLSPLLHLDPAALELDVSAYREAVAQLETELSQQRSGALAARIAEETGAYIESKADGLGLHVRAEVTVQERDGTLIPVSAVLYGTENAALGELIERELGIVKEEQRWITTEEGG